MPKTSSEIRQAFLNYFAQQQHHIVPSSSLVPTNDPTLLFTNAGMVQFKDVFLGVDHRDYTRAVSAQRCLRAGGKHNDLENVGYTARHHTFFEMLGNFSFGDYFKREAIRYAWGFLTEVLKLPKEKLWVTVYVDDDEAADIWLKEMQIDPARFSRCGVADNFWSMGDTGPCGPCSEIFYDHGPEIVGGPPGSPEADGDRYIEIWNLVFMQFERSIDGTMKPLPKPSVDTGMGLERLAAVLQGVHNNYDTDLFQPLIRAVAQLAHIKDLSQNSLKVIADHIRAAAFLITDGVLPSNEGRGYVLRRIIRRALRHGNKLGLTDVFFYQLVAPLVNIMGDAYPELVKAQAHIEQTLLQEEQQFARTLAQGLKLLEVDIANLTDKIIPGATVFKLYDTYGFPVDLTADVARERGLIIDEDGFAKEMAKQREMSQQASKFNVIYPEATQLNANTHFAGYETLEIEAKVIGLFASGQAIDELATGVSGTVVLDHTPFYAESGGQIGDRGRLIFNGAIFEVTDTKKQGQAYMHHGRVLNGKISLHDHIVASVNLERRQATARNHSATHLLGAALRQVLGTQVDQKGSLVEPERLRYDFNHLEPVTAEQLEMVERIVNEKICENLLGEVNVMPIADAMKLGAVALFGEKYGDEVRVLRFGDYSIELCGGTHVQRTGDIGLFKITAESGIAAGIRRIEAVTGKAALDWITAGEQQLRETANLLKAERSQIAMKTKQSLERVRDLEKQLEKLQTNIAKYTSNELLSTAEDVADVKLLVSKLDGVDNKLLREMTEQLRDKLQHAVVILASVVEQRINIIVAVNKHLSNRYAANQLLAYITQQINGKGGGKPDFAQGSGSEVTKLDTALASIKAWILQQAT